MQIIKNIINFIKNVNLDFTNIKNIVYLYQKEAIYDK